MCASQSFSNKVSGIKRVSGIGCQVSDESKNQLSKQSELPADTWYPAPSTWLLNCMVRMAHIGNLGDGLGNQFTDFRRCRGVASVSRINIRGPIACLKHKTDCFFIILRFMLQ